MGGESELGRLKVNWAPSAEARFYGCKTAVNFCQRFANSQRVPAWGFDTDSSFSGAPGSKSKMVCPNAVESRSLLVGQDDRGMVIRRPAPPKK